MDFFIFIAVSPSDLTNYNEFLLKYYIFVLLTKFIIPKATV